MVMEAKKSPNLPPSSWRPRKASGIVQSKSEVLNIKEANDINPSLSPKAQDPGALTPKRRRRWMSWL